MQVEVADAPQSSIPVLTMSLQLRLGAPRTTERGLPRDHSESVAVARQAGSSNRSNPFPTRQIRRRLRPLGSKRQGNRSDEARRGDVQAVERGFEGVRGRREWRQDGGKACRVLGVHLASQAGG